MKQPIDEHPRVIHRATSGTCFAGGLCAISSFEFGESELLVAWGILMFMIAFMMWDRWRA